MTSLTPTCPFDPAAPWLSVPIDQEADEPIYEFIDYEDLGSEKYYLTPQGHIYRVWNALPSYDDNISLMSRSMALLLLSSRIKDDELSRIAYIPEQPLPEDFQEDPRMMEFVLESPMIEVGYALPIDDLLAMLKEYNDTKRRLHDSILFAPQTVNGSWGTYVERIKEYQKEMANKYRAKMSK